MARKTKECGACFEAIDARATICPNCRSAQAAPGAPAKRRAGWGRPLKIALTGFMGLTFLAFGLGILAEAEDPGSRTVTPRSPLPTSPADRAARRDQMERRAEERRQAAEQRAAEEARKQRAESEAAREAAAAATAERCEKSGVTAYVMTQDVVRSQLLSPGTADFPTMGWGDGRSITTRPIGDCAYEVRAFVDSQNGFGALLRSRYTAKVRALDGGAWQVQSLEFH